MSSTCKGITVNSYCSFTDCCTINCCTVFCSSEHLISIFFKIIYCVAIAVLYIIKSDFVFFCGDCYAVCTCAVKAVAFEIHLKAFCSIYITEFLCSFCFCPKNYIKILINMIYCEVKVRSLFPLCIEVYIFSNSFINYKNLFACAFGITIPTLEHITVTNRHIFNNCFIAPYVCAVRNYGFIFINFMINNTVAIGDNLNLKHTCGGIVNRTVTRGRTIGYRNRPC